MIRKQVILFAANLVIFVLICGARPANRTHDYTFSVTGVVTAEDDTPIQDAVVTLEVSGQVYDGVELVKRVQHKTNDTGGFVFAYISHKRGVKYTISVHKQGFEPATVSGSAPPAGHHTIPLKKGAEKPPAP
jgi:hypothetical protein